LKVRVSCAENAVRVAGVTLKMEYSTHLKCVKLKSKRVGELATVLFNSINE
jgi:hypothetical protein